MVDWAAISKRSQPYPKEAKPKRYRDPVMTSEISRVVVNMCVSE